MFELRNASDDRFTSSSRSTSLVTYRVLEAPRMGGRLIEPVNNEGFPRCTGLAPRVGSQKSLTSGHIAN